LASGSFLVISHATAAGHAPGRVREAAEHFSSNIGGFYLRDRDEVAALFGDLRLIQPGLVNMAEWRPEPGAPVPANPLPGYAAVGRRV
jgi:hypothetical protein